MSKPSGQTLLLAGVLLASGLGVAYIATNSRPEQTADAADSNLKLESIPFDGTRAYEYLKKICDLGPRPSGSDAMVRQQKLLTDHFEKLGAKVTRQEFQIRHPVTGVAVPMVNLIVMWHADRKERVLLAAHYDTRPYPDQDTANPRGKFVGANDGASGAALLMELGEHMPKLKGPIGVDFLLDDGEEFVFSKDDPYFLGTQYFARDYVAHPPGYKYRCGAVLDMLGDKSLDVYLEQNSMAWPETRPFAEQIWATAKRLGVQEFVARQKHDVQDDHFMLRNVGGIPTCDLIDFDYPYWHKQGDTPDKCSALSLAKVGWVLSEWLKEMK